MSFHRSAFPVFLLVAAIVGGIVGSFATAMLIEPPPAPPPVAAAGLDTALVEAMIDEALVGTNDGPSPNDLRLLLDGLERRLIQTELAATQATEAATAAAAEANRAAESTPGTGLSPAELDVRIVEALRRLLANGGIVDVIHPNPPPIDPHPLPEPTEGALRFEYERVYGISLGIETEGALDESDGQAVGGGRDGAYGETYVFTAQAGRTYQIDVVSPEGDGRFDTYLALYNPSGALIGQDDDGGGNLNSRIVFTPQSSGNYRATVTSYSVGATGRFRVTVQEVDPSHHVEMDDLVRPEVVSRTR